MRVDRKHSFLVTWKVQGTKSVRGLISLRFLQYSLIGTCLAFQFADVVKWGMIFLRYLRKSARVGKESPCEGTCALSSSCSDDFDELWWVKKRKHSLCVLFLWEEKWWCKQERWGDLCGMMGPQCRPEKQGWVGVGMEERWRCMG